MSKRILIMGLPGSGKTTLAQALKQKLNAEHFNADEVRTQWFNVVAQFDGANRSIWVNGAQLGSQASAGLNVSSSLLQVGATNVNGSEPLQGKIGQALIYNRALTSTEIAQNYSSVRARYGV